MAQPVAGTVEAKGFSFKHASRSSWALKDLEFTITPGERVLLVGPSGAGKSTLLAAIAGILDSDEAAVEGTLTTHGVVGMVLQDPDSQVIASRVGDDVAFGCENLRVPREEIWPRVSAALEQVGLADLSLDHPTHQLSGGQKQRLALAGVLAMGADIIVLDEPTANLDPEGVAEVVNAITTLAEGTDVTIIVVEHRVQTWLGVAQRVIALDESGELAADGDAATVLDHRGALLASLGVWVPGFQPNLPSTRKNHLTAADEAAITAHDLVYGWDQATPLNPHAPLDLHLPQGTSTVITGKNGAGKSTLMLTLAGLLPALRGSVNAHPRLAARGKTNPWKWKSRELADRFGYVFQDPEHQFVARTVKEELQASAEIAADTQAAMRRADEIMQRLQLDHLAHANPFTLSGGQKRRLSVATVLVNAPQVVFLDEPTFGQDANTFTELVTLIRELTDQGVTTVSITHDELYHRALGDNSFEVRA